MVFKAYLSHHGTKGQKWGVQNGPPYPLNDTVKAIAFRGGRRKDGTYIENLTEKDVRKARKLVDKHLKTMTAEEIKEYKDRLMMEKEMGTFIHPKSEKLKNDLSDAAINAVTNSVRNAGTTMLTNLEVNAVGKIVGNAFGEDAAAMITDGITQYQAQKNKFNQAQTKYTNETTRMEKETERMKQEQAKKVYEESGRENQKAMTRKTNAEAEEKELSNRDKRDNYNKAARDEADERWQSEINKSFEDEEEKKKNK